MLNLDSSTRFKKDNKACIKRKYNMLLLQEAVDILRKPTPLPVKNKDHILIGNYAGCRECHILPDWLLIYQISDTDLYLVRTGTHADLYGK